MNQIWMQQYTSLELSVNVQEFHQYDETQAAVSQMLMLFLKRDLNNLSASIFHRMHRFFFERLFFLLTSLHNPFFLFCHPFSFFRTISISFNIFLLTFSFSKIVLWTFKSLIIASSKYHEIFCHFLSNQFFLLFWKENNILLFKKNQREIFYT